MVCVGKCERESGIGERDEGLRRCVRERGMCEHSEYNERWEHMVSGLWVGYVGRRNIPDPGLGVVWGQCVYVPTHTTPTPTSTQPPHIEGASRTRVESCE